MYRVERQQPLDALDTIGSIEATGQRGKALVMGKKVGCPGCRVPLASTAFTSPFSLSDLPNLEKHSDRNKEVNRECKSPRAPGPFHISESLA